MPRVLFLLCEVRSFIFETRVYVSECSQPQGHHFAKVLSSLLCNDKSIFLFHHRDELDFILIVVHLGKTKHLRFSPVLGVYDHLGLTY